MALPVATYEPNLTIVSPALIDQRIAVQRVIEVIRADPSYPHTLDTLADIACFSPFHFARVFRSIVGIPPGEYLTALRFERAKKLLLTTDNSITDICYEVGYASLGSFSARFKHLVGTNPIHWRQLPHLLVDLPRPTEPYYQIGDRDATARVSGWVHADVRGPSQIFLGLFPARIAQGSPTAGTMTLEPGPFEILGVPPGRYRLLATAIPAGDNPLDGLIEDHRVRVGSADRHIHIVHGTEQVERDLWLIPRVPIDPPILTALAPLVHELPGLRAS